MTLTDRPFGMPPRVAIVLLNWNGWRDTIECLESLFRLEYPDFQVIVCDNASSDGSVAKIKDWAEGRQQVVVPEGSELASLTQPGVAKPIRYAEYDRVTAEGPPQHGERPHLVIVNTGANLGFSGGNNVGIRHALRQDDVAFVWILNNDTVVDPRALDALVARAAVRPDLGITGSTLLYYDNPKIAQATGGATYFPALGLSRLANHMTLLTEVKDAATIEAGITYIVGASMLVRRALFDRIGLLEESYFLFYEEIDFCKRAIKAQFSLGYAPGSFVYHKVGRSSGSGIRIRDRSISAETYMLRSRIMFIRRFYPWALPTVIFVMLCVLVRHVVAADWPRVRSVWKVLVATPSLKVTSTP